VKLKTCNYRTALKALIDQGAQPEGSRVMEKGENSR
jgi:hypothetical protein